MLTSFKSGYLFYLNVSGFENSRLLPGQRYTFFQRSYFDPTDLSDNKSGNFMLTVQTKSLDTEGNDLDDTEDDDLDGM